MRLYPPLPRPRKRQRVLRKKSFNSRSFYFLVHPDFFGGMPKQRLANEVSSAAAWNLTPNICSIAKFDVAW